MAERRPDRTLGHPHDEFWAWCGKGELRLQRCTACGEISWPAAANCDFCGGQEFSWERMSGRGRIVSWCSFERDYYQGMLPLPWPVILVELEEGPLFISNPLEIGEAEIRFNMEVMLAFIDCEDKAGGFSLPVFRGA
jgi:uncharacterized OB-fold protein